MPEPPADQTNQIQRTITNWLAQQYNLTYDFSMQSTTLISVDLQVHPIQLLFDDDFLTMLIRDDRGAASYADGCPQLIVEYADPDLFTKIEQFLGTDYAHLGRESTHEITKHHY